MLVARTGWWWLSHHTTLSERRWRRNFTQQVFIKKWSFLFPLPLVCFSFSLPLEKEIRRSVNRVVFSPRDQKFRGEWGWKAWQIGACSQWPWVPGEQISKEASCKNSILSKSLPKNPNISSWVQSEVVALAHVEGTHGLPLPGLVSLDSRLNRSISQRREELDLDFLQSDRSSSIFLGMEPWGYAAFILPSFLGGKPPEKWQPRTMTSVF